MGLSLYSFMQRGLGVSFIVVDKERIGVRFQLILARKNWGHPLATPVNRNEQNPTTEVVFPSLSNLSSQPLSSLHTWFSFIGCAAHQSPIRIKASVPCGARPLAALAAPENLLFPTVSNSRGQPCRPHRSMALHECNPTPCGSRCGRNKLL